MAQTTAFLFRETSKAVVVAIAVPALLHCLLVAGMKAEIWALNAHLAHEWSMLLWMVFLAIVISGVPQGISASRIGLRSRTAYDISFAIAGPNALLILAFVLGFFDNYGAYTGRAPSYLALLTQRVSAIGSAILDVFEVLGWIGGSMLCLVAGLAGLGIGRAYWNAKQSGLTVAS